MADRSVAARCVRVLAGLLIVLSLAGEIPSIWFATRFFSSPSTFVAAWRSLSLGQQVTAGFFFIAVNGLLLGAVGLWRLKRWGRTAVISILALWVVFGMVESGVEAKYIGAMSLALPIAVIAFLVFGTSSVFCDAAHEGAKGA